jgi:maleylpyruvate isomerase
MILHGYFRSTASWRVRIALALKGLEYEQVSHHIRKGDQNAPAYKGLNPQGLLPTLILDDGRPLTQSLAIIEYLDEVHPASPLLPASPLDRARVRAAAMVIACDIHPIQNLKILGRVQELAGEDASKAWAKKTIDEGLATFAALIADEPGQFCFGNSPTLADICLIPQLYNARRFGAKSDIGRITDIERACMAHPAFYSTRPETQPDAE